MNNKVYSKKAHTYLVCVECTKIVESCDDCNKPIRDNEVIFCKYEVEDHEKLGHSHVYCPKEVIE